MSSRNRLRSIPVCFALLAIGCNFGLDSPTLVKTPRILAIVADPPEAAPGEDVAISVMAFDPMGRELTYAFRFCIDPGSVFDANSFDESRAFCSPMVADGFRATVPGERTRMLETLLTSLTPAQTGGFDPAVLLQILDTAGFPGRVLVDVMTAEGVILVSGHKLFGITRRAERTHNPPQPALLVNEVPYVGRFSAEQPFDCVTLFPETVLPDSVVTLEPADDSEMWAESFPIFDFTGGLREGRENGYYSWYATGGSIAEETTQHPRQGGSWHAPIEEGTYRLWYVVRDGHLGTSPCTFELEVRAE